MKRIFKALLAFLLILLAVSCTVTPEDKLKEELYPKLTHIDTPTGVSIASDHKSQSIFLTWNPVENATYYIVEYQKGKDFLGGSEPKQYRTVLNSFPLEDNDLSKDKRYLFRIIAVHEERNDRNVVTNTIKSEYTDYFESAIIDYLSVSRVIQDNRLEVYPTYSKNTSVLDYSDLFDVDVKIYNKKYFDGAIVDDSWEILNTDDFVLQSNTSYSFTAVLWVNGEQVDIAPIEFKTSINYVPDSVKNIKALNNEKDNISLSWEPINVAEGVVGEAVYSIQRKLSTETKWKYIMDKSGAKETPLILTEPSYIDRDVVSDVDYDYRVVTGYKLTEYDSIVMQKEADATFVEKCHIIDTKPLNFTAEIIPSSEKNKFTVSLNWDLRSSDLLANNKISFKIFRKESNPKDGALLDKELVSTTNSVTDEIVLTDEQHYSTHVFYYELQYLYEGAVINTETIVAKNSHDDSTFMYEIKGTRANIDFIESFSVNKGSATPYANKIVLDWGLTIKEKVDLDVNKLLLTLTRRDINSTSIETIFSDKAVVSDTIESYSGQYIDETAMPGIEYKYQLEAKYVDPDSVYNEFSSQVDSSVVTLMSSPTNFVASRNMDDSTISLSWTPVADSNGYRIGYKKENEETYTYLSGKEALTNPQTKSIDLTSADGIQGGVMYDFSIQSMDSESKETAAVYTKGCFIGPIAFNIENGADYIKLTWDKHENIKGYKVNIHDSTGSTILYSVPVDAETPEFTLDSKNLVEEVTKASSFPLSEEYGFSVIPSGLSDESKCEIKKGSWIRPPRNITATRAAYKDMIIVNWDNAEQGHSQFNIYRKKIDENQVSDYEYLAASGSNASDYKDYNADGIYEYTVSVTKDGKEGPRQNVFMKESALPDSLYQNRGYNIMVPRTFYVSDISTKESTKLFMINFSKELDIDSYTITVKDRSYVYPTDFKKTETLIPADRNAYDDGTSVTLYLERPDVTDNIIIPVSIMSVSNKAVIHEKNYSAKKTDSIVPNYLNDFEIMNLFNSVLRKPLGNANSNFDGDWWRGPGSDRYQESGVDISSCPSSGAFDSKMEPGSLTLSQYQNGQFTVSCSGTVLWARNEGGAGYLGTDPLDSITGTFTVSFPYDYPTYTIVLSDWGVSKRAGSATINGASLSDINKVTVNIL